MKAITSKANVAAKEEEFKSKDEALTKSEELFDDRKIIKVELAVHNIKQKLQKKRQKSEHAGILHLKQLTTIQQS